MRAFCYRFDMIVVFFHYLWVGPIQMTIVTFLMYQEVSKFDATVITMKMFTEHNYFPIQIGVSAIAGMIFLLAFIPFQCKFKTFKYCL